MQKKKKPVEALSHLSEMGRDLRQSVKFLVGGRPLTGRVVLTFHCRDGGVSRCQVTVESEENGTT